MLELRRWLGADLVTEAIIISRPRCSRSSRKHLRNAVAVSGRKIHMTSIFRPLPSQTSPCLRCLDHRGFTNLLGVSLRRLRMCSLPK